MWIHTQTLEVAKLHQDVRRVMANMDPPKTLPEVITDDLLTELNWVPVEPIRPSFNPRTHKLVEGSVVQHEGKWTLPYSVEPLTPEERKTQVPQKVTARQGVAALIIATGPDGRSLYDYLQDMIDQIEDPTSRRLAKADLDRSKDFERHSNRVRTWGAGLGLTEEQVDDLFVFANTIPA